jgi:hypothetical protein
MLLGHRVPDLCLTIPSPLHQISYSCHDSHCCPSCCTCHLHTISQANVILYTNKGNSVETPKYLGFKFKHRHVNESSQLNQSTEHFSQSHPQPQSPWERKGVWKGWEHTMCSQRVRCSLTPTLKIILKRL